MTLKRMIESAVEDISKYDEGLFDYYVALLNKEPHLFHSVDFLDDVLNEVSLLSQSN